jgi:hypothetical protein
MQAALLIRTCIRGFVNLQRRRQHCFELDGTMGSSAPNKFGQPQQTSSMTCVPEKVMDTAAPEIGGFNKGGKQ